MKDNSKRKFKTTLIHLLSKKSVRIKKSDVAAVHEQQNIEGGIDVGVFMKSGFEYWVGESKAKVEARIYG